VYWECSARGTSCGRCPAMVVEKAGSFRRGRSQHTHGPVSGMHAAVALASNVHHKARNDLFAPASAVVAPALTEVDIINRPHDNQPNPNNMVCLRLAYKSYDVLTPRLA